MKILATFPQAHLLQTGLLQAVVAKDLRGRTLTLLRPFHEAPEVGRAVLPGKVGVALAGSFVPCAELALASWPSRSTRPAATRAKR
jgi:hypothetical protein